MSRENVRGADGRVRGRERIRVVEAVAVGLMTVTAILALSRAFHVPTTGDAHTFVPASRALLRGYLTVDDPLLRYVPTALAVAASRPLGVPAGLAVSALVAVAYYLVTPLSFLAVVRSDGGAVAGTVFALLVSVQFLSPHEPFWSVFRALVWQNVLPIPVVALALALVLRFPPSRRTAVAAGTALGVAGNVQLAVAAFGVAVTLAVLAVEDREGIAPTAAAGLPWTLPAAVPFVINGYASSAAGRSGPTQVLPLSWVGPTVAANLPILGLAVVLVVAVRRGWVPRRWAAIGGVAAGWSILALATRQVYFHRAVDPMTHLLLYGVVAIAVEGVVLE